MAAGLFYRFLFCATIRYITKKHRTYLVVLTKAAAMQDGSVQHGM